MVFLSCAGQCGRTKKKIVPFCLLRFDFVPVSDSDEQIGAHTSHPQDPFKLLPFTNNPFPRHCRSCGSSVPGQMTNYNDDDFDILGQNIRPVVRAEPQIQTSDRSLLIKIVFYVVVFLVGYTILFNAWESLRKWRERTYRLSVSCPFVSAHFRDLTLIDPSHFFFFSPLRANLSIGQCEENTVFQIQTIVPSISHTRAS